MKKGTKTHKLHSNGVAELLEAACLRFCSRRSQILSEREGRYERLISGELESQSATEHIRNADWSIERLPSNLEDQRSCLIGSANREDLISGINSSAKIYFADLWNMVPQKSKILYRAHRNIKRTVDGTISLLTEDAKQKVKNENRPALAVIPRPLHVTEKSVHCENNPIPAALYDVIVHCLQNGERLLESQGVILFGLRRVFSHLEARWFDSLFSFIEHEAGFPRGSIKAYVFIDTIESVLEVDEILFELRTHSAGLTCDPQRYAFSHIQLFQGTEEAVMPDREKVGLDSPFLKAMCKKVLSVAHRRRAHALFPTSYELHPSELEIPVEGYDAMKAEVISGISNGFDGAIFSSVHTMKDVSAEIVRILPSNNQLTTVIKDDVSVEELIQIPEGALSTASLIQMVRTALRYRMAERIDKPWAIQGGKKHDRSSMKLCLGILRQWRSSNQGVISDSGLPIDDQLLKYLVEKETTKMFSHDPGKYEMAKEEAAFILARISA